jgi:hypothetical protein
VDVIPFGAGRVGHCYTGFVLHHGIGQTMWTDPVGGSRESIQTFELEQGEGREKRRKNFTSVIHRASAKSYGMVFIFIGITTPLTFKIMNYLFFFQTNKQNINPKF